MGAELKMFPLRSKFTANNLQNISRFAPSSQAIVYKTFRPFGLHAGEPVCMGERNWAPKAPPNKKSVLHKPKLGAEGTQTLKNNKNDGAGYFALNGRIESIYFPDKCAFRPSFTSDI